jgi:hypothetical protein
MLPCIYPPIHTYTQYTHTQTHTQYHKGLGGPWEPVPVELSWRTYKSKTSDRLSLNSSIFRYRCSHTHRCTHMRARARAHTCAHERAHTHPTREIEQRHARTQNGGNTHTTHAHGQHHTSTGAANREKEEPDRQRLHPKP